KMFSLAVRWGMRADNPAKGIELNTEAKRRRYLTGDELARLTVALAEHSNQGDANIIRLLLMTGARRGEVLGMRWADLDLAAGTWNKPASATKQKREHAVPLSAPVRQLLAEIRNQQAAHGRPLNEWVFPGAADRVWGIKGAWTTICKASGII